MRIGKVASLARRAGALALVAVLVPGVPVFADTTSTPTPTPPPAQTQPPVQGPTRPAPTAPAPTPSPSTPPTTSERRPPSAGSELDAGVDGQTEEFRRELAEQQARLDVFMAQLDALDRELELATEEYNAAMERLNETKQRVQVAKSDLEKAQSAYALQSEILGDRAASMYRDGTLAAVEVLFSSKSVSDFMARVKFLNTIGMRDADIVASLKGQKALLESQMATLETAESDAVLIDFELKARQIEIMLRIQERQEMLTEAQTDLVVLLDQEAARRRGEESALMREILSGANEKGIVVMAGSPVETALAYHGIPYLWGGKTPSGFDCSGLMFYVFQQHGVTLPHYSGSQFLAGVKISPVALQPGDAVFFGSPIHHVGMYMGGGYYIHAPRTGDFVKISKLADRRDYAGARRYAWQPRIAEPKNAVSNMGDVLGTGAVPN